MEKLSLAAEQCSCPHSITLSPSVIVRIFQRAFASLRQQKTFFLSLAHLYAIYVSLPLSLVIIVVSTMFSAGRVLATRFAVRAATNTTTLSALARQPQTIRTFAAATFLDAADVTERIIAVVKNFDQVDANKVTPKVKFTEDLGLDSLDVVEVVMAIEDEFAIEIPDTEADKIASIEDAVEYITSHPMAK